jgi:hypothetical protein
LTETGINVSWNNNDRLAARNWFSSFMERNPPLFLRTCEGLSKAMVAGVNENVVDDFTTFTVH